MTSQLGANLGQFAKLEAKLVQVAQYSSDLRQGMGWPHPPIARGTSLPSHSPPAPRALWSCRSLLWRARPLTALGGSTGSRAWSHWRPARGVGCPPGGLWGGRREGEGGGGGGLLLHKMQLTKFCIGPCNRRCVSVLLFSLHSLEVLNDCQDHLMCPLHNGREEAAVMSTYPDSAEPFKEVRLTSMM